MTKRTEPTIGQTVMLTKEAMWRMGSRMTAREMTPWTRTGNITGRTENGGWEITLQDGTEATVYETSDMRKPKA